MTPKRIAAVSFDLWDTLIQEYPGGAIRVAQIRIERVGSVLASAGFRHSPESIMEAHEKTGQFLRMVWGEQKDLSVRDQVLFMLNSIEDGLAGRLGEQNLKKVEEAYSNCILDHPPRLLPGSIAALESVRQSGVKMCLISNTGRTPGSVLRLLMKRLGILEFFDITTFSNETLIRKPSEGVFRETLDKLEVARSAAVHVGDDPESDIAGAKRAGLMTIQILREGAERSAYADYAVKSIGAVPAIIEAL